MPPLLTFFIGLILLGLFASYFFTDAPRRKRWIGLSLIVLLAAFCVESMTPLEKKLRRGLDLKGGSSFLIRLNPGSDREISPDTLEQAIEVIRSRVDRYGVAEPLIQTQGQNRILVQIPGLDKEQVEEAQQQLQRVAKLEFKLVHPESAQKVARIEAGLDIVEPGWELRPYTDTIQGQEQTEKLLLHKDPDLTGDHVTRAHAYYDTAGYGVSLTFDGEGAKLFGDLTAAHVGDRFAIVLDGEVKSAPVIQDAIYGGQAQITGRFSEEEARSLASVLENPLQTPVVIEEQHSVSATLGAQSIRSGVAALLGGMALVLLFVLVYYQLAGLVAIAGLLLNIVLLFGIMAMFQFTLTLPGIAGIVLVIGMAIDANVLIFERLREEMATGKPVHAAIESAYNKAFSAIFDANITTLITSAILFWKASGPVRGFAITLTVGIAASMFSSLLATRNFFSWASTFRVIRDRVRMLHLLGRPQFDFLGKRRIALVLSISLVLASVAAFAVRGEKVFGIDFRGGDVVQLQIEQNLRETDLRRALAGSALGEITIQRQRTMQEEFFLIRGPFESGQPIVGLLQETFPDAGISVEGIDKVGPVIGKELLRDAMVALGMSLVGILLYLSFRFEFSFAVAALAAVTHDVLVTLGLLSMGGVEFSLMLVGAILTVAGYSINDTIIVFDRIREGLLAGGRRSTIRVMNEAINATLSRTVITSGTTLLSLIALYFFGGPVLRDFAITIIIGVLIGTYSTIFIASPIALWWARRKGATLHQEVREQEALA